MKVDSLTDDLGAIGFLKSYQHQPLVCVVYLEVEIEGHNLLSQPSAVAVKNNLREVIKCFSSRSEACFDATMKNMSSLLREWKLLFSFLLSYVHFLIGLAWRKRWLWSLFLHANLYFAILLKQWLSSVQSMELSAVKLSRNIVAVIKLGKHGKDYMLLRLGEKR